MMAYIRRGFLEGVQRVLLAALVVIVAVFFLFLHWLRPLPKLRAFARRISHGDYDQPERTEFAGEIGDLARELTKMADRLREREEMVRNQARELVRAERFSTIGKMSSQIAHEVRNPLNALGLKLELLEERVDEASESLPPKTHAELSRAIAAAGKEIDRLREITDYYLRFAKFPQVEKEQVDISPMLADLLAFYEDEALRKGVRIVQEIERPLWAHADPDLLRHAVVNLLKNASEAIQGSERGDGTISLKAWSEKPWVRIQVKDDGPGMDIESLELAFEPFFSNKRSGTGLGLTLVQQIVTEHGGEVTCSSQPGEGTVFRISLPLRTMP